MWSWRYPAGVRKSLYSICSCPALCQGVWLTDEQADEVRRRLDEKDPETLALEEFKESLRRFGE